MKIEQVLNKIKASYSNILKANLVGIYVHGSYAFGCFNEYQSELDLIVVVNHPLSTDVKESLLSATIKLAKLTNHEGIEMSVVLKQHCQAFQYPTPYEQHISNTHQSLKDGKDYDLATHFSLIKSVGVVLFGQPIERASNG